ncbi:TldD/PmbA family protein [Gemmatimonas groenlandica]|uniref:TldD/PmbA family protein n=1 Tax=Gemmatimonas groenlandica TaxID=2732249 RepID=A0A6M4IN35_9BACT|nr:TldD/PmbA family protein [Gemmatimonas groenlandica]QJR35485.1 TldD/PmbA family protein [Gemmatimonas groenlandica]
MSESSSDTMRDSISDTKAMAAIGVLSREQAQAIVERAVKLSKADAVRVSVNSSRETNLRFADNQMSTSGVTTNSTIRIQSVFGKRKASVVTNDRSDEGLRRAVEQSEALARLAPEDPEYLGELPPQTYAPVNAWFDRTADLSAEDRAKAAMTALAPARAAKDLTVAGFIICNASASAIGNSAGLFAYHRGTSANYTLTARTTDGTGSGWVGSESTDWSAIDFQSVADRAIDKARRSRNPVGIEPGRYTVIFEPEATANLVSLMGGAFQARSADEGRSAFSKAGGGTRLGEKIVDERVTLISDPGDALILGSPFDGEGMPTGKQTWVQNGVLNQLAYNRFWANKQGKTATGGAQSLRMASGKDSIESMIASTTRGVLVTRLWYLRPLDARTLMYTGLTRDGTFLIENGKIARSIKNFRFNDSPLFMLNNLEGVGAAVRTAGGEGGPGVAMPPIKVRDFNFSSSSDAV